ncbi:hypothetical protein EDF39_0775 [Frondihabitans sp. PhB161]|nr:hypothetical protein EDF37_0773 [Frondihabitans sp. PhB153]RPF08385.1 hypothetical protein EDF39_0775 [Frondihabitans sp. PhB161]
MNRRDPVVDMVDQSTYVSNPDATPAKIHAYPKRRITPGADQSAPPRQTRRGIGSRANEANGPRYADFFASDTQSRAAS